VLIVPSRGSRREEAKEQETHWRRQRLKAEQGERKKPGSWPDSEAAGSGDLGRYFGVVLGPSISVSFCEGRI
jgi:hypothetical protein